MNILIATDLSKGSVSAALFAFRYARRQKSAGADPSITVVHSVHSPYPKLFADSPDLDDEQTRSRLETEVNNWLRTSIDRMDLDYDVELREGRPDHQIRELADELGADLVAVGVAGQGALARMIVGSTAERLAHDPPANLAICHPRAINTDAGSRFAVGVDFTRTSGRALQEAASLARQLDGTLDILHVVAPPSYESYPFDTFGESDSGIQNMEQLVDRMRQELDTFLEEYTDDLEGLEWSKHVLTGYPTQEIVGYAEDNDIDGIILGAAGRSAVADLLMGSVERGVVKHMPCTVFLTPPA